MSKKLFLIGRTFRNRLVKVCTGGNCEFEHSKKNIQTPVLVFRDEDNKFWTLTFWVDQDECGSGWCTADFAEYELKQERIPFDEIPTNKNLFIWIQQDVNGNWCIGRKPDFKYAKNDVFEYSRFGQDEYYPCGFFKIFPSFQKSKRKIDKKPIWIFYGKSAKGKSTLAHETGRHCYETDSNPILPKDLSEYDIIVVGNKYNFSNTEIVNHLSSDVEIIWVNFN